MKRSSKIALLTFVALAACLSTGCPSNKTAPKEGANAPPPSGGPISPRLTEISDIETIAVSPDGSLVAATWGASNRGVGIWQRSSGEPKCKTIEAYYERLVFSKDGKQLIGMGMIPGKMTVWDAGTGKELRSAELPKRDGGGGTFATFLALSPDGKYAYSSWQAEKLVKFDIADGKLELFATDVPSLMAAAYSPGLDELVVIRVFPDRLVALKPEPKAKGKDYPLPTEGQSLALSQDGKTLAVALRGKEIDAKNPPRIEMWDTKEWKPRLSLPKEPTKDFKAYGRMALSSDGQYLAGSGEYLKSVELWDVTAGTMRKVAEDSAAALMFTPDGSTLLIGSSSGLRSVDVKKK